LQDGYIPTVLENFIFSLHLEGVDYELALWDCSGQEDYERLRPLSYPGTEVVVIGYGINDPDSFENVSEKGSLYI
jgi:GTPase SAR1 family protein